MSNLIKYLFQTNAFKICPENKPFWYTSGKIGPYFMNAQFLYGSEEDANSLLEFIDSELENATKYELPKDVFEKTLTQYNSNEIYKTTINEFVDFIKNTINLSEIDYISGGERRDWFFSNLIAYLLDKPHVTIYKDLSTVISNSDFSKSETISKLENKNFLHVADLLNQSASFTRAWIPAIENLGSTIKWALFMIDRMDGGTEVLTNCGVQVNSLLKINDDLFVHALELGIINEEQLTMLREFKKDPMGSMKQFLIDHPEFIENALKSDNARTLKRVNTLIEQNIYGLN